MSKNRNREYREAEKRDGKAREVVLWLLDEAAGRLDGDWIPWQFSHECGLPDIDYLLGYNRRDVKEAYRFLYQLENGEEL